VTVRSAEGPGATFALKERILAAAAASPSPTRQQGRRVVHVLAAAAIVTDILLFQLAGGLAHSRDRPLEWTVWLADTWAIATGVITWLTARFGSPLVRDAEVLGLACLTAPLVLWALMDHAHGFYPDPPRAADSTCFFGTLACAASPLGAFLWARRGSEPRQPAILGAAGGCSAGAWAAVLMLLWCPDTAKGHAFVGHVMPVVVATLVGAAMGARVVRLRGDAQRC
jgi:hypothetical protein